MGLTEHLHDAREVVVGEIAAEAGVGLAEHLGGLKTFDFADDDVADVIGDSGNRKVTIDVNELGVDFLENNGAYANLDPVFDTSISNLVGRVPSHGVSLMQSGNVFHYTPVEIAPGAWEQVSIRSD